MSYQHVHLLDPTAHQLPGLPPAQLLLSREAARSHVLQQALAELRTQNRTTRPARVSLWRRARGVVHRARPA